MNNPIKLAWLPAICFQLLSMTACTAENDIEGTQPLILSVSDNGFLDENQTRAITPMYTFQENDKLSLYVVNQNTLDSYADQAGVINYTGTHTGDSWTQAAQVGLIDSPGTVLAFYPYDAGNINPAAIPVTALSVDYLYGASANPVSRVNTQAVIRMKHVHTLVRFKFLSSSSLIISEIRTAQMPQSGTLNLATGELTASGTTIEQSNTKLELTIPSKKQFDYETHILPGDNIRFQFIVNGKLYFYKPAIKLQIGKAYNITLTI